MKILFTGGSSFTGSWFVKELVAAGHSVTTVFQKKHSDYEGTRKERIDAITKISKPFFGCRFGDPLFLNIIKNEGPFDLLCHHAADVTNYKSPDFDSVAALASNTYNLPLVLKALKDNGCNKIVLTGSVFEQREGAGSDGLPAVSPYGLSKGLTSELFTFYADKAGVLLGKFIIPNPFGPYEELRFTSYLAKKWIGLEAATCDYPRYIRDNIHVSLLAKAYRYFVEHLSPGFTRYAPSGYPESQGTFTLRFSRELSNRLKIPCEVILADQTEFPEPKVRINTDLPDSNLLKWDETTAWDELAEYYLKKFKA